MGKESRSRHVICSLFYYRIAKMTNEFWRSANLDRRMWSSDMRFCASQTVFKLLIFHHQQACSYTVRQKPAGIFSHLRVHVLLSTFNSCSLSCIFDALLGESVCETGITFHLHVSLHVVFLKTCYTEVNVEYTECKNQIGWDVCWKVISRKAYFTKSDC